MLPLQFLADLVLLVHFCVAAFVVGALVVVLVGNLAGWRWVNGWWFRLSHIAAIGFVVAESWLGVTCPLTTLESWLRALSGAPPYERSFIAHWLQRMLFYEAPEWVFSVAYTFFALLVALAWWRFPPVSAGAASRTHTAGPARQPKQK